VSAVAGDRVGAWVAVGRGVGPEVRDGAGEVAVEGAGELAVDGAEDAVATGSAVTSAVASAGVGSVDVEGVGTDVGTLPRPPVAPLHAPTSSAMTAVAAKEESRFRFMASAPLMRR
jgi:hypothetical protein